jgi:hypothetical protein
MAAEAASLCALQVVVRVDRLVPRRHVSPILGRVADVNVASEFGVPPQVFAHDPTTCWLVNSADLVWQFTQNDEILLSTWLLDIDLEGQRRVIVCNCIP